MSILRAESAFGDNLGAVHPIDRLKNNYRKRQRPISQENIVTPREFMTETVHQQYQRDCALPTNLNSKINTEN